MTTLCDAAGTQAIELVGSMDRIAIADYLRNNKFKIIIGAVLAGAAAARGDTRPTAGPV